MCVCVTQGGFSCRRGGEGSGSFDGWGLENSRWRMTDRFRRGGCIELGLGKVNVEIMVTSFCVCQLSRRNLVTLEANM